MSILLYFSVFATSALLVQWGYKHKIYIIQMVGLLLPVGLAALRYNVGLDYISYLNAYADIINPKFMDRYQGASSLEYSFQAISYLSDLFFSSPIAMFFTYSAITAFAFHSALRVMKPKKVGLALFFFYSIFFLNSFNTIRQSAAISLGCLAITHQISGHRNKSILYSLLAAMLHLSALLIVLFMLFIHFYGKRHLVKEKFSGIFAKTLIVSSSLAILGITVAEIGSLIYSATGRIGEFGSSFSMGVLFKYLLGLGCLFIVIFAWNNFNMIERKLTLFVVLGLIVYALGLVHNEAARIGMYLISLAPILLAVAYDNLRLHMLSTKLFLRSSVMLLCTAYVVAVHSDSTEGVQYQYQSVLYSKEYREKTMELGI